MLGTLILQVSASHNEIMETEMLMQVAYKMGLRFIVDFISIIILIRFVYFPIYKKRELFFTYFIFNIVIFMICFLLNKVDLSLGAAFGLFAVFSMLRYRTEDISLKDMSYLFLVIAIGLISAVSKVGSVNESYEAIFIAIINLVIIVVAYLLESSIFLKKEAVKTIVYNNLNLVEESRKEELIADLKTKTGINVHRVAVQKIDFKNETAQIKVFFYEKN